MIIISRLSQKGHGLTKVTQIEKFWVFLAINSLNNGWVVIIFANISNVIWLMCFVPILKHCYSDTYKLPVIAILDQCNLKMQPVQNITRQD